MKKNPLIDRIQYENKCKYCSYFNGPDCINRIPELTACANFQKGDIIYNLCQGGNEANPALAREKMESQFKSPNTLILLMSITVIGFEAIAVAMLSRGIVGKEIFAAVVAFLYYLSFATAIYEACMIILNSHSANPDPAQVEKDRQQVKTNKILAVVLAFVTICFMGIYYRLFNDYLKIDYGMLFAMGLFGQFPIAIFEFVVKFVWMRNLRYKRKGRWMYTGRAFYNKGMHHYIRIYNDETEEAVIMQILSGYENFPLTASKLAANIEETASDIAVAVNGSGIENRANSAVNSVKGVKQLFEFIDEMGKEKAVMNETGGYNGVDNRYPGINY